MTSADTETAGIDLPGGWNYATVWDVVARRFADEAALVHDGRTTTWAELERRANGIAAALVAAGLGHQSKVAQYQRNGPAYIEVLYGAFKGAFVPVNTNYRYGEAELRYLWQDCEAEAVVFDAEFTETADLVRPHLPQVKLWLRIGDEADCPSWARPYEAAAASHLEPVATPWGRSGDDLYLLYTGGTTGFPKGVMWRQDDLFQMLEVNQGTVLPERPDAARFQDLVPAPGPRVLPAAPLMHGTATWFCLPVLSRGGSVVTLTKPSLDPEELLDTVVAQRVKGICIVGDAFATPILRALDAEPGRWDLTGVRVVFSSGAMLSVDNKKRLLAAAPRAMLVDGLGTSESGGMGNTVVAAGDEPAAASFQLSSRARVIDEAGRDVAPGSGARGRLAVGGFIPLGYYGDPVKTAETFVTIDGQRYVVAGDWAEVTADGEIVLLGRGSSCINTAGEKVYPEEVEQVLKAHPDVADAGVVGMPDERWGQVVTAAVRLVPGATFDDEALVAHVKEHLAGYKAPKSVVEAPDFPRGPNGKLDHKALRSLVAEALGVVLDAP